MRDERDSPRGRWAPSPTGQLHVGNARTALADLLSQAQVAPVTDAAIRRALTAPFRDFEDAVAHAAAQEVQAEVIVTRNRKLLAWPRIDEVSDEIADRASLPTFTDSHHNLLRILK